jgi:hypothetical protein
MVQLFLPTVQVATGQFHGRPKQAAIAGLLAILQTIDVRSYFILMTSVDSNDYHREIVRIQQIYVTQDSIDYTAISVTRQPLQILVNNPGEIP